MVSFVSAHGVADIYILDRHRDNLVGESVETDVLLGELVALKFLVELRLTVDEVGNDLHVPCRIGTE